MAITDPRAIRFCNEVLRPMAERFRDFLEDVARSEQAWTDEIGALIPNDAAQLVEDGRDAEGISRMTGAEVVAIRNIWVQVKNLRAGSAVTTLSNVDTRIGKACVRLLRT